MVVSLPFKGRAGVGMGLISASPIPLLTSPLKGEELFTRAPLTHASRLTPHASRLTPHASRLEPHASRLTHHDSSRTPHSSRRAPRASRLAPHASRLAPHASRLTPHASRLTPHASRLAPHASRLTPHASRLAPHASRLSPHAWRLTPHGGHDDHQHAARSVRRNDSEQAAHVSYDAGNGHRRGGGHSHAGDRPGCTARGPTDYRHDRQQFIRGQR